MRNSNKNLIEEALLVYSGNAGEYVTLNFMDKSIYYKGIYLSQAFKYLLIDNTGEGSIRISPNNLEGDLSFPINGSKTVGATSSIYLEEVIENLRIYFIETSTFEIIAKSDMDEY